MFYKKGEERSNLLTKKPCCAFDNWANVGTFKMHKNSGYKVSFNEKHYVGEAASHMVPPPQNNGPHSTQISKHSESPKYINPRTGFLNNLDLIFLVFASIGIFG